MTKRCDKELTSAQLANLPDEAIDTSEMPELDEAFWAVAKLIEPEGTAQIT